MSEIAVVIDAGGLIAVERGSATMHQTLRMAISTGGTLVVPAPVLAQAWRGGSHQALLARFLKLPIVEVDLLSRPAWQRVGELCGASGTHDVVDAAVVVCARERGCRVVITSDPDDLLRLDPDLIPRVP